MACGSCQKRAQERLARMKQQAELIKKMQSTPSEPARKEVLPPDMQIEDANTEYFEAKMKLFGKL